MPQISQYGKTIIPEKILESIFKELCIKKVKNLKSKKDLKSPESLLIEKYPNPGERHWIKAGGSKNCALPIIMYCFLVSGENRIVIKNVPKILDVKHTLIMFKKMGGEFIYNEKRNELIVKSGIKSNRVPRQMLKKTRISVLLMSILLVKYGRVSFAKKVGGCNLGDRNYDYHLDIFSKLGCVFKETGDDYEITKKDFVQNKHIAFIKETTTGTENALFLANFNSRNVTIKKAHLRPEVLELIKFMKKLGAKILTKNNQIYIKHNQKKVENKKMTFIIIDDADEALGYLALGLATDSNYKIKFNNPYKYKELETLSKLSNGAIYSKNHYLIQTPFDGAKHNFVKITTGAYPRFSSDAQPIFGAVLLLLSKSFQIKEGRFVNRFGYLEYLNEFGIKSEEKNRCITVKSTAPKINQSKKFIYRLRAYDLRSAMCAVVIASVFKKRVIISNIGIISRGYSNFFSNLWGLGFRFKLLTP